MVRDTFIEIMVKKKKEGKDWLIIFGILLLSLSGAAIFFYFGMVFPFAWVLAGLSLFFGYFFISRRTLEFEYSLTNDWLDVDQIIAKRNRKRLIAASCKNFENFGKYDPEEHIHKQYAKKIFACTSKNADDLWFFVARGSNEGNALVVFNGSERLLEGIKAQLPRQMAQEVFGR